MPRDKRILYAISISLLSLLLIALFLPNGSSRYTAAILLLIAAGACLLFIKKRSVLSYNKNQVLGLLTVLALVFLMLLYLTGLYFGFMSSYQSFSSSFLQFILPNTIIIISVEIVRRIMLAHGNKAVDILCYLSCLIADVLMSYSLYGIETFNRFMDIVGLTLLPAVTANFLYHYIGRKYGSLPNIVYRLIITVYAYILPVVPAITEALTALIRLILPMIAFAFIYGLFEKRRGFARARKKTWISYISITVTLILMISIVMLISCQFRYGALVIATESMTGELNKGDVTIYEQYDGQVIKTGQVVVFERYGSRVVHRVAEIESVNGEIRYYTKGDIYDEYDVGYITESDIIGLARARVPYIGYPTIWLNKMF